MNWPQKLRMLADWIDMKRPDYKSDEVQQDLRKLADLIAAGVLVPVPDGEECEWQELEDSDMDGLFIVDGQLCCRDRGSMGKVVAVSTGASSHIYDEDIVQPVRLVPLAEMEADHG